MTASLVVFDRGDEAELGSTLLSALGSDITHDEGHFYTYIPAKGFWSPLSDEFIHTTIADYAGSPVLYPKPKLLSMSHARAKGAAAFARARLLADANHPVFADETAGVVFGNGFVSVSDGKVRLQAHDPKYLARHGFDFDFDPTLSPDRLLAFFDELFEDIDVQQREEQVCLLQEFIGVCLVGEAARYQRCLLLHGDGANGKSSAMQIVGACFPSKAVGAIPPQDWGKPFRLAGLTGTRINIVNEMPEHDIVANSTFKSIITGEPVTGEHKYQPSFTFASRAGHLFSANSLPATNDHSSGFWRRFMVIPFTRDMTTVPYHRPDVAREIIDAELPAIVAWALDGAARVQQRGGYSEPVSSKLLVNQWRQETDSVRQFLQTQCSPTGTTPAHTLHSAYRNWAIESGYRPLALSGFGRRANLAGYKSRHTSTGNVYDVRPQPYYLNGVTMPGVQPSAQTARKTGSFGKKRKD